MAVNPLRGAETQPVAWPAGALRLIVRSAYSTTIGSWVTTMIPTPDLMETSVDISDRFVRLAAVGAPGARFVRGDARRLPVAEASFDAAISLCQGGFGLVPGEDGAVVDQIAAALKPGGAMAISAFSSYFVVRFLEEGDTFDPEAGVNHEIATVKNPAGVEAGFDLWTSCFTPRELRLLCRQSGLEVDGLWSVAPGDYARRPPDLDHPEWLVVARKM